MGPPKPTCLEDFMVNNMVFGWPKPLIFDGFGGPWYTLSKKLGYAIFHHPHMNQQKDDVLKTTLDDDR